MNHRNPSCGKWATAARDAELQGLYAAYPQLPCALLRDLFARHGLAVASVLGDARTLDDLGRDFGGGLYQREAEYCIAEQWAQAAGDILWRRTKTGLHMSPVQRDEFADWFAGSRVAAG